MRGAVLAGGLGTRLLPLTKVTNKHLLPVAGKPMIFWPIQTLVDLEVTNICIVVGGNSVGDILNLLKDGEDFGADFTFRYQREPLGIAHALLLAEDFAQGEELFCILGDNIFLDSIPLKQLFEEKFHEDKKACIFLTESEHPERFGCVKMIDMQLPDVFPGPLRRHGPQIVEIIEKPKEPPSNYIVTGLYFYPNDVFDYIRTLKPSERGELEITDVNNWYIKQGRMNWIGVGHWCDAGTPESLFQASAMIKTMEEGEL